jgi:hypothetical protein
MSIEIKWYGDKLQKAIGEATAEGLIRAAAQLHSDCRVAVSKSNPRNRRTGINDQPSAPGQPPRLRTGFGRENIVFGFNGDKRNPATRVGVRKNGLYMYWLEVGFRRKSTTIRAKSGRKLKIPFRGTPTADEIKKIGLKKIGGAWFYFRRQVTLPPVSVAARPWLLATLYGNQDKYARLAALGGQSKIA